MSPTLNKARRLQWYRDLGTTADSIAWWSAGCLLADGVSVWESVTGRAS